MTDEVATESAPCPLGCAGGDALVLTARDRLHGLPGEWRVVRCSGCGLMRTNPRPKREAIAAYYPRDYQPFLDSRVDSGLGSSVALYDPLNRAVPDLPPGRLLEVGCGSGSFLHTMAGRGWQVRGLEPSADAAAAAREAGYDVIVGRLEDVPDLGGRYDLIAGWMVVEHLHDPLGALARLREAAAPAGWLAISVPDAGSWEFRAFGDAWYGLDLPRHLFHYTPETLRRVAARAGWRLERIVWQRDPKNLLYSLRHRCLDHGWERLARWLGEVGEARRLGRPRAALGVLLGALRASGRMTAWAKAA